MVLGAAIPCFLGNFALFSGIREKIYYALIGAKPAKEGSDVKILAALGPG